MPDLREALLEEHLRSQRLGTLIRASLTPSVYDVVMSLREKTRRTYRDIFLIVLNIFKHHPELFPVNHLKKARQDIRFRISKNDSMTVLVWAWERNQRRSNFVGDLTERFLEIIPASVLLDVLVNHKDHALRLKEDSEDYERVGKRT